MPAYSTAAFESFDELCAGKSLCTRSEVSKQKKRINGRTRNSSARERHFLSGNICSHKSFTLHRSADTFTQSSLHVVYARASLPRIIRKTAYRQPDFPKAKTSLNLSVIYVIIENIHRILQISEAGNPGDAVKNTHRHSRM